MDIDFQISDRWWCTNEYHQPAVVQSSTDDVHHDSIVAKVVPNDSSTVDADDDPYSFFDAQYSFCHNHNDYPRTTTSMRTPKCHPTAGASRRRSRYCWYRQNHHHHHHHNHNPHTIYCKNSDWDTIDTPMANTLLRDDTIGILMVTPMDVR